MIDDKTDIRIKASTQDLLKEFGLPLHGQEAVQLERTLSSFYVRGYVDRGKDQVKEIQKEKARKKKKNKKQLKNNSILHFIKEAQIDQGYHANELRDE